MHSSGDKALYQSNNKDLQKNTKILIPIIIFTGALLTLLHTAESTLHHWHLLLPGDTYPGYCIGL